ncbi:MAG: hypothetical protein M3449_02985, partial [Acidobacteriota bacterium]|nr:hypothetical protein [Acidobacteriota bacterium]
ADADLVIVMIDGSEEFTADDKKILDNVRELNHLIIINKIDKISTAQVEERSNYLNSALRIPHSAIAKVSAKTRSGLTELQHAIIHPFAPQDVTNSGFLVTDARHYDLLLRAKDGIESSLELLDKKTSEEIVLVGLHNALRFLGQITGETTTEDMLTQIFSTFCIGK